MKKLLTILLLLPIMAFSQFSTDIEIGYLDEKIYLEKQGFGVRYDLPKPAFYIDVDVRYNDDYFELIQLINSTASKSQNSFSMMPIDIYYETIVQFKLNEKIRIGASHSCMHPLLNTKSEINSYRRSAGNKIFIKFKL